MREASRASPPTSSHRASYPRRYVPRCPQTRNDAFGDQTPRVPHEEFHKKGGPGTDVATASAPPPSSDVGCVSPQRGRVDLQGSRVLSGQGVSL